MSCSSRKFRLSRIFRLSWIFRLKAEATVNGSAVTRLRAVGFGLAPVLLALVLSAAAPRAGAPANGPAQLVLLPDAIVLRGQGSRQQLLVEERAGETYIGSRTAASTFTSSNPNVATVDAKGVVTAVRDGRALITVRDGARVASTMVEVERAAA